MTATLHIRCSRHVSL